jgi:transketolase
MDKPDYKKIANDARIRVLEMIYKAQTSHIGSNYSCVDLLAVIFEKINLDCDKFILSKGWAAASLYYFLK